MAMLRTSFNAADVAPAQAREVLPAGKYNVQIVASEMKTTSTGGEMLVLEMDVIDGPHQGRKIWDRLNLVNNNATAVEIAERALSAICHATGVMSLSDSEELHFRPMTATVKVRPAGPDKSGTYRDASNEIGGYAAMTLPGSQVLRAPAPQPQRPAPQPAPAPAANSTAPWKRGAA